MLLMLAAGALLLGMAMQEKKTPLPPTRSAMQTLVRNEALRQGVPPAIALAVAEVESNFNPAAQGDMHWASKKPELYIRLVRDNPKLAANPARHDPAAWHSYGLFQLLAPHHIRGAEHPRLLLEPGVNAQRGIAFIKALLKKHGDDLAQMRLAYAGALNANAAEKARVLDRFTTAYGRWHDLEAQGLG